MSSSDSLYLAFENRFRGDADLISKRLEFYSRFASPVLRYYSQGSALDLGAGRGEWLQILKRLGFIECGVDLSEEMVKESARKGLRIFHDDAQAFLSGKEECTQLVVSAFHLLEHLTLDSVVDILRQSERVLLPGGVFIAETPNPDNLSVGANKFYIDPTHVKPMPSQLLEFLAYYTGFRIVKIVGLQQPQHLSAESKVTLRDVLSNVSPDYGIIAVKDGPGELIDAFSAAFAADHGVTLASLSDRFDRRIESIENSLREVLEVQSRPSWIASLLRHAYIGLRRTR